MAWVPVNRSVFTHRKTMKMADLLDIPEVYAVAHLTALWTWAMDNAPTGVIPAGTSARMIARAAEYPGNAQGFLEALLESEYLAVKGDAYEFPNWMEYGGKLIAQQEKDAERKRLGRAKEIKNPSDGCPPDVTRMSDVEKKRKEYTPLPPREVEVVASESQGNGLHDDGMGKVWPEDRPLPNAITEMLIRKGTARAQWEQALRRELQTAVFHGPPAQFMAAILRRLERQGLPVPAATDDTRIRRAKGPLDAEAELDALLRQQESAGGAHCVH